MTIYDDGEVPKTPLFNLQDGNGEQHPRAVYVNDQDGNGERMVWPYFGSTVTRTADDRTSTGQTGWNGVTVNPNTELKGLRFTISANTDQLQQFGIQAHTDSTSWVIMEDKGKQSTGTTLDLIIPDSANYLQAGTAYDLLGRNGGDTYTRGSYSSSSFPYTSTDIDATGGMYSRTSTNSTNWYCLTDVIAILP